MAELVLGAIFEHSKAIQEAYAFIKSSLYRRPIEHASSVPGSLWRRPFVVIHSPIYNVNTKNFISTLDY
jgi:hypothetical protein